MDAGPSFALRGSRGCVEPDDVLDLALGFLGLRAGQVDLVDDRDNLEIVLDREIGVGERLRSTPCEASTISSAPSQAASDRETS